MELEDFASPLENTHIVNEVYGSLEQFSTAIIPCLQPPSYTDLVKHFRRESKEFHNNQQSNKHQHKVVSSKEIWKKRNYQKHLRKQISEKPYNSDSPKAATTSSARDQGPRVLHKCCRRGDVDCVRLLLLSPSTDLDALCVIGDVSNITPLHLAVQHKHYEVARQLLEGGCQVNTPQGTFNNRWCACYLLVKLSSFFLFFLCYK